MAGIEPTEDDLQPDLVRAQLERVLESPDFARADRASAFLRFIVEETLESRASHIKAFTIALEVFGRDETFNPQTDTIVRVEAGALRRRLERYYFTTGQDDPIIIDIPKGAYVPVFRPSDLPGSEAPSEVKDSTPVDMAEQVPGRRFTAATIAGSIVVIALVTIAVQMFLPARDQWTKTPTPPSVEQGMAAPAAPFVAVLPLETPTESPIEVQYATGLVESVIMRLTMLSGLSVMAHSSVLGSEVKALPLRELHRDFGVTHVLRGTLQIEDQVLRINSQLIEANTGVTVWAGRYELSIEETVDMEQDLVMQVAAELGVQLDSDELLRLQRRHTNGLEVLKIYRDAMQLLYPPTDRERMLASRALFERTVSLDPSFAPGYAGRSINYSFWTEFDHSQAPKRDIQMAVELARIAIDMDRNFGLGHAALGVAYSLSDQMKLGLDRSQRAVELDPGDAACQGWLGLILVLSGRPDEAIEHITEAIRLNPLQVTSPYLNFLGIAYFNTGRFQSATEAFTRNIERGGPSGPHMKAILAATYAELGREDEARAIIRAIGKPATADFSVENFLVRWIPSEDHRRRTLANLRRLGLAVK